MNTSLNAKVVVFVLIVAALLAGGIGITGAAAQSAIPGDALYRVKTTIESTQLTLAQDAGDRAQMELAFAERRLTEIGGLISDGRYREIREAVLSFEGSINAALLELEKVAEGDPQRAAHIMQEVTSALTRYARTLSELAAIAPESVRPEVTRALDTTQIVSGLGQASGNENANDNSSTNTNANDNSDDNTNSNANDDNVNVNANTNANDNGSDDSNTNANDNGSDDNGNSNSNDNGVDDSGNANTNANDNGVDDNSNDDSGSLNSNDNGGVDDNGNDNSGVDDNGGNDNGDDNGNDDDRSGRGGGGDDNDNSGKDD